MLKEQYTVCGCESWRCAGRCAAKWHYCNRARGQSCLRACG